MCDGMRSLDGLLYCHVMCGDWRLLDGLFGRDLFDDMVAKDNDEFWRV